MNILPLTTADDVKGTQLENPAMQKAYQNMVADATPEFYVEHLKRLRQHQIQPYFQLAHVHQLEEIEHLIRTGVYKVPLNHNLVALGGAGGAGRNPFDFMEYVRRSPHGSVPSNRVSMANRRTVRGHGGRAWNPRPRRHRGQYVAQERRAHDLRRADRASRSDGQAPRTRGGDRRRSAPGSCRSEPGTTPRTRRWLTLDCRRIARVANSVSLSKETDGRLTQPVAGSDGHPMAGQIASK